MEKSLRRRSSRSFGPQTRSRKASPDWRWRGGLALFPAAILVFHLAFGMNTALGGQLLVVFAACALGAALATSQLRAGLHDLRPRVLPLVLFCVVIGVAALSLTPIAPGGPNPLWTWAGVDAGASTINKSATFLEILKLCGLACAFMVGALQGARKEHARWTLNGFLAAGAVYAMIALVAFLSGTQLGHGTRLSGGLLSANSAATVFGVLAVLGLSQLLRRMRDVAGLPLADRASRSAGALALFLLPLACLILTASRMGLAATAVAVAALCVWEALSPRGLRWPAMAGAGAAAVIAGLFLFSDAGLLAARLEATGSVEPRGAIFAAHWQAFLDSPLMGFGLGTFPEINNLYMTAGNFGALQPIRAAHNVYLQWLEEGGLIGAVPMFALIAALLFVGTSRALQAQRGGGTARGLVCASLVVLVHGFTDFALQVPSIAMMWAFLLGLSFAYGQSRS